jgi:putative Mg2+ transporter-C (MgtC) family protein
MDEVRLLPRLLVAFALGVVLGVERERRQKPAGLRTHTVVCLSTATLMAAAHLLQTREGTVIGDPTRMAQGILTGIGFIGAGTIVRQRAMITGITTAATIWLSASIGMLAGAGFFILAAGLTALSVTALDGMEWLVERFRSAAPAPALRQESDREFEQREDD